MAETRIKQFEQDRQRRYGQMRRRILKAAMRLFLKRGFENVTMRNIASGIGYSPAAIYRYFADKNEIFFALRGEGFERFYRRQLDERKASDPALRLREHAAAYLGFALDNPEYYEMMFVMRAPIERSAEKEEWSAVVRSLDLLRDDVRGAIDAGVMRGDLETATLSLWSILHGALSLALSKRLLARTSVPLRDLVTQVESFVFDNLFLNKKENKPQSQNR